MAGWTADEIADQSGRTGLVTGATDGIGYEAALHLAAHGMRVLLAGRNRSKGDAAVDRIRQAHPGAEVRFEPVELGDLASVRALADRLRDRPLDLLVNNAGLMALPSRRTTADGFEMQFGVNYLSHFALTGWLSPALRQGASPRVVNLSSLAHRGASIAFDDLPSARRYSPVRAYAQSKLAMLMFACELQRRSDAGGWGLLSVAAHPGIASTNLMSGARRTPEGPSLMERALNLFGPAISQSAAAGALPTLYAATAPDVVPGGYYGPDGFLEMKGAPKPAKVSAAAAEIGAAGRLWTASQALTGDPFETPA